MTNKEKKPKTQTTAKRQSVLSTLEYKQQVKDGVAFINVTKLIKKRDQNKA
ncbi:MAG: hypothetical protein L3J51_06315 [Cocleimonas sp.]|nr:hypothetical protein [Cocleimonas sp.]